MNDQDFPTFAGALDSVSQCYQQKEPLKPNAIKMYFACLADYTFEQVNGAMMAHLKSSTGQFFPKPADIIRHIEGGDITPDQVIAAARIADTPLGILCRIQIGSWDLDNQDAFYLRQRAAECLQLMSSWKAKALAGEYSDHEISIMLKHDVNPASPFNHGMLPPVCAPELSQRAMAISQTPKHQFFLEKPHSGESDKESCASPEVKGFIEQEMKRLDNNKLIKQI